MGEAGAAQKLEMRTEEEWHECEVSDYDDLLGLWEDDGEDANPAQVLDHLFSWEDSPEGNAYWHNMHGDLSSCFGFPSD